MSRNASESYFHLPIPTRPWLFVRDGLHPTQTTLLGAIMTLAFAMRLGSMHFLTGSVDWEGAEYIRLAQNLIAGNGYIGINLPGKNLMFPPLYPYFISGLSLIVGNFEISARLISVALGTATVIPAFLLARALYNETVGYVAALVVAFAPLLVHFSGTGNSETTYLFFVLCALAASVRCLSNPTWLSYAVTGFFLGLAYLTRVEAAPLLAAMLAVHSVDAFRRSRDLKHPLWPNLLKAGLLPATFALVALPYVFWLSVETGQLRIEGKSPLNIQTAARVVLNNEDINKVHFEVDTQLNERGIWMRPYLDTIKAQRLDPIFVVNYIAAKMRTAVPWFGKTVLSRAFGTPALFGLIVLGLILLPPRPETRLGHSMLLLVLAVMFLESLLIVFLNVRFILPMLPILLIWASAGIVGLVALVPAISKHIRQYTWGAVGASPILAALALCVLAVSHIATVRAGPLALFNQRSIPIKSAAQDLAKDGAANRVLVGPSTVAFHANAKYCPFPYTDSDTALRYFDKRGVNYLVISNEDDATPYLKAWWDYGVPSPAAVLMRSVVSGGVSYRIYRWTGLSPDHGN